MILVVTDTCIFIDLWNIELLSEFFELKFSIHTTLDVLNELDSEQQEPLKQKQFEQRLIVHNLTSEQRVRISEGAYPVSLSEADKSVLYLAEELKAMVISSDKVLRNCAKRIKLEFHGILWIIEHLVNEKKLDKKEGIEKLELLLKTNSMMKGSKEVMVKITQLRLSWSE